MVGKTCENTNGYLKTLASWTAMGALGLGLLAYAAPPMDATAQSNSKAPNTPETKGVSDVVRAINGPNSDVGMVMLFHFDGTIDTFGVQRSGETENTNGPPADRTTLGEMTNVQAEIYQYNPNCITWQHGGSYYTICR